MVNKVIKSKSNYRSVDPKGLITRHSLIDKIMTLTTPIWDNKAKRLKPKMTIAQACSEVGITSVTYNSWLREDPVLEQMVEEVHASHRQMMEDMANSIIMEGLNGDVKLRPSEKISFAFRYLEKTSPHFNPAQKIEMEANNNNFNMSEEEILNRLRELSQETGENFILPTVTNQEDVNYTEPDITETTTSMEKEVSSGIESEGGTTTSGD